MYRWSQDTNLPGSGLSGHYVGLQAWWPAPLPDEPSHRPYLDLLKRLLLTPTVGLDQPFEKEQEMNESPSGR